MFNNEEIVKLKAENENLKSQLQIKTFELQQLQQQFEHKNNELVDLVADVFLNFRKITDMATRNDYGQPKQKIRQIQEYAESKTNYFARLTINTPKNTKIELPNTDQSTK